MCHDRPSCRAVSGRAGWERILPVGPLKFGGDAPGRVRSQAGDMLPIHNQFEYSLCMPVSPEDIKKFVTAKWQAVECPRCKSQTWQVGNPEDFKGLIALGDDQASDIGAIGQKFLPSYWLICTNCGHVEWIATKVVRKWVEEGRPS